MAKPGLFKKKEVWVPTWKGWLLSAILLLLSVTFFVSKISSFLSLNRPVKAELLLVDDWLPDYALEEMLREFHEKGYQKLIITGGREVYGWNATKYKSSAELLAAKIVERGLDSSKIRVVNVSPSQNNRTHASSVATKAWLTSQSHHFNAINIVTVGVHARRSYYLFKKSLGDRYEIGVISIDDINYDNHDWWNSSQGFKEVIMETLAYIYTSLFL